MIYERIHHMELIGKAGLERLQQKRVAIFGVGNLGSQFSLHLGLLGIPVTLIDRGLVEEQNLVTQGYEIQDLGKSKVQAMERRIKAINPNCSIIAIHSDFKRLGMGSFKEDLFVCCLDSLNDRVRLSEVAYRLGNPLMDCAIDGTGQWLYGKVFISHPGEEGPCYLCQWDLPSLHSAIQVENERAGMQQTRGCPSWRFPSDKGGITPPTLSISSIGGVISGLASILAIQILLEEEEVKKFKGIEIAVDFTQRPYTLKEYRVKRNPLCLFDHQIFRDHLVPIKGEGGSINYRQVFKKAEDFVGPHPSLILHGREMIRKLKCPSCRVDRAIWKLAETIQESEFMCTCGEEMVASPQEVFQHFDQNEAQPVLDKPLSAIGLPQEDIISAMGQEEKVHFLIGKK